MKELTHISLFSGIGGIDLVAHWAGFRTICFVEIDPYCRKVLNKHWPDVPIIGDIRDATREKIQEIVTNATSQRPHNQENKQALEGEGGGKLHIEQSGDTEIVADPKGGQPGEQETRNGGQGAGGGGQALPNADIGEGRSGVESKPIQETQFQFGANHRSATGTVPDPDTAGLEDRVGEHRGKPAQGREGIKGSGGCDSISGLGLKKENVDIADSGRCVYGQVEERPAEAGVKALRQLEPRSSDGLPRGSRTINPVTLITGGFPCQPVSAAGRRKGKADDRWLWPEMLRVISEVRPTWVVAENVAGLIGMVEYDSSFELEGEEHTEEEMAEGLLDVGEFRERTGKGSLDEILESLESIGYSVQPFVVPACAVNAPHRRDRIFIVAHASNSEYRGRGKQGGGEDSLSGINREALCSRMLGRAGDVGDPKRGGHEDGHPEAGGEVGQSEQRGVCESEGTGDVTNPQCTEVGNGGGCWTNSKRRRGNRRNRGRGFTLRGESTTVR